jgi:arsenical pump membrane protein
MGGAPLAGVKVRELEGAPPAIGRSAADGPLRRLGWLLAAAGLAGAAIAFAVRPADAARAAGQDWSPFVLVAGLLVIGLVANGDGLFAAAGQRLARLPGNGVVLFCGSVLLVSAVTATLNLDTSVAFLTPVLVHAARSRGGGEPALVYGCLLLSNAGSLLLPGSNLTNLIVLGQLRLTGGQFAAHMWLPWFGAVVVTALVVAVAFRRSLTGAAAPPQPASRPVFGLGLAAVVAATAIVIVLRSPAVWVLAIGVLATGLRVARGRVSPYRAWEVAGVPVLAGLFGAAVALGTVGRAWEGPAILVSHMSGWATAAVAAVAAVLFNNLPAASMLAAHPPAHPFALLVGLNVGPNLCVTGSLAWLLWLRAARDAGARPSLASASRLGAVAVPVAIAVAIGLLAVTGGT